MIKFNTPEIKAQKIKDSIEILKKWVKIQNSSLYGTTTTTTPFVVNNTIGNIFPTTVNNNIVGSSTTTPFVVNNTIGNIFPTTVNTNIVGSSINTTTPSVTLGVGLSNAQSQLVINNNNNSIGSSSITNSITTGSTPTTIGTITGTTIYGSYHSNTLFQSKYTLLGSNIVLPYLYNGEMIVALINTLGIDFWDEYVEAVDFKLNNKESFDIIEGVMKLQRRDAKLDSIINDK